MTGQTHYLAVVEIDERPDVDGRATELESRLGVYNPSVTATPGGRIAVQLHIESASLEQAALESVAAVTQTSHSDAVALAVMPEEDVMERSAVTRRVLWGIDTTWLDDLWL